MTWFTLYTLAAPSLNYVIVMLLYYNVVIVNHVQGHTSVNVRKFEIKINFKLKFVT